MNERINNTIWHNIPNKEYFDSDLQCSSYHQNSNSSNVCAYVSSLPNCQYDDGFVQYIHFTMCTFSEQYRPFCYIILLLWMFYMFIMLGVTAEDFFCPCLKTMSKVMRMSDSLAGVTLLALGNGAPDIFSVIAAVNNKNPRTTSMAFQELFGAGIFVTTIVAGAINIKTTFKMARRPFLRDIVFYLAAVVWTFVVIYKKEIKTREAVGFIVLYLLYVSIVIVGQIVNRLMRNNNISSSRERLFTVASTDGSSVIENDDVETSGADGTINNGDSDDDEEATDNAIGSITEAPLQARHPRHRLIRDISITADFSSFNYSADVAHLFKKNKHSERTTVTDLMFHEHSESTLKGFVRPINLFERLVGIREVDWKCQSIPSKVFSIIKVPIIFVLTITCPVVDRDVQGQKWDKWLAIWHCFASPLFCVFALEVGMKPVYEDFLVYHLMLILGSVLGLILFFISSADYTPKFHAIFAIFGFAVAVVWIKSTAQEVVNLLQTFGWISRLSYGIMGLTLLAWGNSIGAIAKKNEYWRGLNLAISDQFSPRQNVYE